MPSSGDATEVTGGSEGLPKPPARLPPSFAATSPTPIVIGIASCVVGFLLIVYCWSQVALRMHVADQVAYIVSSGFTAIGLIVVGATIVSIQVRRRDAEHQFRRLERLVFDAAGEEAPPRSGGPRPQGARSLRATAASLREPIAAAIATSVAVVVAGFALLAFAWYRAADEPDVAVQIPYVVSGGLGGLALIAVGAVLTHVLYTRGLERERGDVLADVIGAVRSAPRGSRS